VGEIVDLVERIAPIVARALAKRHGLGDHMPVDAWMKEAVVATRTVIEQLTNEAADTLLSLQRDRDALREALKPFAHYAALNDLLDSKDPERAIEVPVRDLLAAYALLHPENEE
jgi:hypothetical protein